jgi:8-oxo-dGTP diphosphatase
MDPNLIPNVSVDCVVFGFDFKQLNVLLIERKMVFEGVEYKDFKLPGDLIGWIEDLNEGATRVLKSLTGLDNIFLKQFLAFGALNRLKFRERDLAWLRRIDHPEERVITIAFYSLINIGKPRRPDYSIQADARWCPVEDIGELAFDHNNIVIQALEALRTEIKLKPIAFELLPDKFTLSQLQKLYEVVIGTVYDKRNFRKKISQVSYIVPINEKQTNVSHKPARLYMFSRDVYAKTHKDSFDFSV